MTGSPFTLHALLGAAERLRRREARFAEVAWLPVVEEVRDRLSRPRFEARPLAAFTIARQGKDRLVASPELGERLIEEALMPLLRRTLEPLLLPCVHAYRPGRSTYSAAQQASKALGQGFRYIALVDIEDFYPSIDRGRLVAGLSSLLPAQAVDLIASLVSAPLASGDTLEAPERGIPAGRPIAPMLANFYLIEVDRAACAAGGMYLRYGDDFFLGATSPEGREALEGVAEQSLTGLGLRLSEKKRQRLDYDGTPFAYLGHLVSHRGVYERVADARLDRIVGRQPQAPPGPPPVPESFARQPNRRSQTLYVTEPGLYLSMQKGLVVARRGKETVREVPLHRVDRILVLAGASMSSGFLSACVGAGVPVLFFVGKGRAFGSLVAGGMPNPLRLRAQYELLSIPGLRLALARQIVEAKMQLMVRRLASTRGAEPLLASVEKLVRQAQSAPDTSVLRGFEGAATRCYYQAFVLRITGEGFGYEGRSRRPPRDPFNSLLSFTYSLLFGEMQTSLLADGLDPYPGVFHDLRSNHPALASDLIEPYRILLGDAFVLRTVNSRRLTPSDFEALSDGGVYLTREARRTLLADYEGFMDRRLTGRTAATPRRLLQGAARAMLRVTLGEAEGLDLPLGQAGLDEIEKAEP